VAYQPGPRDPARPAPEAAAAMTGQVESPFVDDPRAAALLVAPARLERLDRLAPVTEGRGSRPAPPVHVQVTIGRVEVRATPPSAAPAPRPQRPAPAVLSLEEYLRQRDQGGGR
jgi:hypothetical protein